MGKPRFLECWITRTDPPPEPLLRPAREVRPKRGRNAGDGNRDTGNGSLRDAGPGRCHSAGRWTIREPQSAGTWVKSGSKPGSALPERRRDRLGRAGADTHAPGVCPLLPFHGKRLRGAGFDAGRISARLQDPEEFPQYRRFLSHVAGESYA